MASSVLNQEEGPSSTGKPLVEARNSQTPIPLMALNSSTVGEKSYSHLSPKISWSPKTLLFRQGYDPVQNDGVLQILSADERPTFIIDMDDPMNDGDGPLVMIFTNNALKQRSSLLNSIAGHISLWETASGFETYVPFRTWATSDRSVSDISENIFDVDSTTWTCTLFKHHLRIFKAYQRRSPHSPSLLAVPSPSFASYSSPLTEDATPVAFNTPTKENEDYFGSAGRKAGGHSRVTSQGKKAKSSQTSKASNKSPSQKQEASVPASKSRSSAANKRDETQGPKSNIRMAVKHIESMSRQPPTVFDWTLLDDVSHLSKHIQFVKSINWGSTPLGPMDKWSSGLRQAVNLIMACPFPSAMYWGEELVQLYNEAYILLAGPKHPGIMGKPYREGWKEIWDFIKDPIHRALEQGESTSKDNDLLFISRYQGNLEECYFSWSLIPLIGSDGMTHGLYNPAFEQTSQIVGERRMATLQKISEGATNTRDKDEFWQALLSGLEQNKLDHPFIVAYSVQDDVDSDSPQSSANSSCGGIKHCVLKGQRGVVNGSADEHPLLVSIVDLQNGQGPLIKTLREVLRNSDPTLLSLDDGTLNPVLLQDVQGQGFQDLCRSIVVCPIFLPNGTQPMGYLLTGVNSRRPYDKEYRRYISILSRQAANSLASVVLFEEEVARSQRQILAAEKRQLDLSEKLRETNFQVDEIQERFELLTELNPVGLFYADAMGEITYCNQKWYDTMNLTQEDVDRGRWMSTIVEDDVVRFQADWQALLDNSVPLDTEIRLERSWTHQSGSIGETWALVKAKQHRNLGGEVKYLGCITDISQQKWAEHAEKRRVEEAVTRKVQQEQFLDMTSHEMRNPLSAILQCADELERTAQQLLESSRLSPMVATTMHAVLDIANTLSVCGSHEKRIVDDILTVSKMDANKLKITPQATDPKAIIEKASTMFHMDLRWHEIKLDVRVDESFDQLGIKYVNVDPSRILTVLINLTTNSIKFTSRAKERRMAITLSASLQPPGKATAVRFVPRLLDFDPTKEQEWGDGQDVYIHYAVSDTGKGLSEVEMSNLFGRFTQANDQTHVTYGGSGLGLYIARTLSEMQGGQIGVASIPGQGSVFAFYVKAKRTDVVPPQESKAMTTKAPENVSILLVEDNPLVTRAAARTLTNYGCNVLKAENGQECLDVLKGSTLWRGADRHAEKVTKIDVILMDQEMPVMDGLACTQAIRKLEEEGVLVAHVPIIGTTANARPQQVEKVFEAGMDDAVSKPFTMRELFPKVVELVERFPAA